VLAGIGLIMVPALVPWFLDSAEYGCAEVPYIAAALKISGFAMIAVAVWTGVVPGAVGLLTWAIGGFIATLHTPEVCRDSMTLALANSLFFPVALVTAYLGVRAYQQAAEKVNAARLNELLEVGRATAAADLNLGLSNAVDEGLMLLTGIAEGLPVDSAMRVRLESVDARIRSGVQVDALVAGGFDSLAVRVVHAASAGGASVSVRALSGSEDRRPIPTEMEEILPWLLATGGETVIQVFTDGVTDYLSLVVDSAALGSAGLAANSTLLRGDVVLQVYDEEAEDGDATPRCLVLLTRPVEAPQNTVAD
jgi:hypothetical protein